MELSTEPRDRATMLFIKQLSAGQKSAIKNLYAEPALLGCSEPYAKRLSVPTTLRPALTFAVDGGDGFKHYGLTKDGLAVKEAL